MVDRLRREISIDPSFLDSTGRLGIPDTSDLFMDMAAEHSNLLGIGQNELGKTGGFWLTVKSMIRFYRRPGFGEHAVLETWPEAPDRRKCMRDYILTGEGGTLAAGKTEWAVLDFSTGRLRHVDTIYPEGLSISDDISMEDEFRRFDEDLADGELLGTYRVRSTDIDMGGHMNNVAYIRAFASMYSTEEWNALDITYLEVWYRAQCFEGETLTAKYRKRESCTEVSLFKEDGTCALQLRFS